MSSSCPLHLHWVTPWSDGLRPSEKLHVSKHIVSHCVSVLALLLNEKELICNKTQTYQRDFTAQHLQFPLAGDRLCREECQSLGAAGKTPFGIKSLQIVVW